MSAAAITAKLTAISDLIRLPRQYGTALVLAPTLWALFIASGGMPQPLHLFVFVLGAFFMRSAGCAINDLADREFDRIVERTKTRPVAGGRLLAKEAAAVFLLFSALAFVLVLFLNRLAIALSFVGILLASVYPFVKRVSSFPQAFLGAAFGWGAVMAWAAVTGDIGIPAIFIFVSNVFWATAYDTIYALMDMEDDIKAGVKSTAIFFGKGVYTALSILYAAALFTLALAGWSAGLGPVYYAGLASSCAIFYAIVYRLKENPTKGAAFSGFVANAGAGFLILFSIIVDLNT